MGADTHGERINNEYSNIFGPGAIISEYSHTRTASSTNMAQTTKQEAEIQILRDSLKAAEGLIKELYRQLSFYADQNQNQ